MRYFFEDQLSLQIVCGDSARIIDYNEFETNQKEWLMPPNQHRGMQDMEREILHDNPASTGTHKRVYQLSNGYFFVAMIGINFKPKKMNKWIGECYRKTEIDEVVDDVMIKLHGERLSDDEMKRVARQVESCHIVKRFRMSFIQFYEKDFELACDQLELI